MKNKKFFYIIFGSTFLLFIFFVAYFFMGRNVASNDIGPKFFFDSLDKFSIRQSFDLNIKIDPAGKKITATSVYINFPKDLLECREIKTNTDWNVLLPGKIDNIKGEASITVGVVPGQKISNLVRQVAVLSCQGKKTGKAVLNFGKETEAAAIGESKNVIKRMEKIEINID